MTPDIVRLVLIHFDSLENHNPVYHRDVGLFMAQDGKTAEQRAEEWKAAHPEPTYQGWDGQTYPQWVIVRCSVL